MTSTGKLIVGLAFFCLAGLSVQPLLANDAIEVTSQGAVEVLPDVIWIEGQLSGSGDLAEAKKVLQGLKEDIRKALADSRFQNVKSEFSKLTIRSGSASAIDIQRQMMEMMGDAPPNSSEGDFTIAEDFKLVVSGLTDDNFAAEVERMMQLASELSDRQIKLAKGSEAMFNPYVSNQGSGHFMRVGVSNPEAVWKTASEAAFLNAKSKAETLARIAGGTLGSALSISVDAHEDNDNESSHGLRELIIAQYGGGSPVAKTGVSQTHLDKIPVKVTLRVRFAYQPQK